VTAAPAARPEVRPEAIKKADAKDSVQVVSAAFPIKSGEYKRVHPLWDQWYRVNFHSVDTNVIVRSYFVSCVNGVTKVRDSSH
jgi:hypothetical protein